jgi:DOPA 4,5-dioxygenase
MLMINDDSEKAADGKSLINPPTKSLSNAYEAFVDPIARDERGGFDVHIYFLQTDAVEKKYAEELHERVRRECRLCPLTKLNKLCCCQSYI